MLKDLSLSQPSDRPRRRWSTDVGLATTSLVLLRIVSCALLLGQTGCATLPRTDPLRPVHRLAVLREVEIERPRLMNPLILSGLVGLVIGEITARSDEKRLGTGLTAAPKNLADVLREEFTAQVSESGRFEVVDRDQTDATAALAITELSLGNPFFEFRERPMVTIQCTISDRSGQWLWRGTTRVNNFDNRTPLHDHETYLKDPELAFEAYSLAIRTAVSDLVKHLAAELPAY